MQTNRKYVILLIGLLGISAFAFLPPVSAAQGDSPPVTPNTTNPVLATSGSAPQAVTWSSGQPYPVVNGETLYPPLAVPESLASPDSVKQHWYAGSTYTGTAANATSVFAQIQVPSGAPLSDEFYYVLASIWDNSGSYDQIAFANDYGVWGLTYSYTTGPCSNPTYVYNPDAMSLTPGTIYKFYITTQSNGLLFEAYVGNSLVWSLHANSVSTTLNVGQYYCGYYNYTDYVENWVSHVAGGAPSFTFTFTKNQFLTSSWVPATWSVFNYQAPPAVHVAITGQKVKIKH